MKELKIIPPDGYEIDPNNSTSDLIRFRHIRKDLDYSTVMNSLFTDKSSRTYYIGNNGGVYFERLQDILRANVATCKEQLQKVLAINKLFNIAMYYNNGKIPTFDGNKYYFIAKKDMQYTVIECVTCNMGIPLFINKADAQEVIDNPNFDWILKTIFE